MNGTAKSGTTMATTAQGAFARQDCFKNLKSGIGSVFTSQNPKNGMMDALLLSKRMDDQKQQIETRIYKLRKDEERAAKRIRDLERLQNFRRSQNEEKAYRIARM